jgi:[acyl-carrier-protein] S-malonyltransferase
MDQRREADAMTKVAFMFPGQGSLEEGMGREIVEAVPEASEVFREGSEASGVDLAKLCFETPLREMVETENQQPALVATSLAINEAIRARGISPDYVVGHSVGEFAALAAARSIEPAEAIALVRQRGLVMAEAAKERPGTMAAILGLADEVVESICTKIHNVWPANYNCPGQVVVSGATGAVEECCEEAEQAGARRAIRLRVSGAFHSPLVDLAAERIRPSIERVSFKEPLAPFVSTVTAKLEQAQRYRELLVEQLSAPVKFTQAAGELLRNGVTVFVEVGPGNVLSGLLKRIDRNVRVISVNDLRTLNALEQAFD